MTARNTDKGRLAIVDRDVKHAHNGTRKKDRPRELYLSTIQQQPSSSQGQRQQQSILPSLSLPKGGGAIRGIGEQFAVNPV